VRCAISREALKDDFGADHRDQVEAFQKNRQVIEARTRQKYVGATQKRTNRCLFIQVSWYAAMMPGSDGLSSTEAILSA
jgi:hypothetical protein